MTTFLFAVRTSPARFLFPVLVAFQLCVLFLFEGSLWRVEWRWAVDWAGAAVPLVGPIIAGYAVWRSQFVRARLGELSDASQAGSRAYLLDLAGSMSWVALSHLVTVLCTVVAVLGVGAVGAPPLTALVWQLAALAGYLGLGYALGRSSTSRLLAPVVAVGLLLASTQSAKGGVPSLWFDVGGATASLAGMTWRTDVVLTQTVLGLALALLPLAALRGTGRRTSVSWRLARSTGRAATVGAVAVPLVLLAGMGVNRFEPAASADDLVCSGADPEVCVLRETSGDARAIAAAFHSLSTAAGGVDAGAPARMVQALGGWQSNADGREFVINAGTVTPHGVDAMALAHYFVWNRDCLWGDTAPPAQAQLTLDDLQQVLLVRARLMTKDGASQDASRLLAAPEDDQRDWIERTMRASEACAFDQLAPWTG